MDDGKRERGAYRSISGAGESVLPSTPPEAQSLRLSRNKAHQGGSERTRPSPFSGLSPTQPGDLIARRCGTAEDRAA